MADINEIKNKVVTYFKGVRSEWGKVIWPERPQIIADFAGVIIICGFFSLLIYVLDIGFDWILGFIPKY